MKMELRRILPGVGICGLSLYLEKEEALVFGDLHLGIEEEYNELGYMIPRFQYGDIVDHLEEVFSLTDPSRVIINGDLKQEFGRISKQEWQEVLDLLSFIEGECEDIYLIKGNHDTILGPIAKKGNVKISSSYYFSSIKTYLCHGHVIPVDEDYQESELVVIGHDHPALALRDGLRVERVKCFLVGKYDDKDLIQIPSLSFVTEGTDITQEKPLSPFMQGDLFSFNAYCVAEDRLFDFGKIGDIPL